jgi:prophage regulatory protein
MVAQVQSADGQALPRMLTKREVADMLGIVPRTVDRLRILESIPQPVRIGGSVRWPSPVIEAWIAAGCPEG